MQLITSPSQLFTFLSTERSTSWYKIIHFPILGNLPIMGDFPPYIMFGLYYSNGILKQRTEKKWKFPEHKERINPLTGFTILVLFNPLCIFTLSRAFIIQHNLYIFYFKNVTTIFGLYTISPKLFMEKAHTGNCRLFHGPLLNKQQYVVEITV